MPVETFGPSEAKLWSTPIAALGLRIEGTQLEPILEEFRGELAQAAIQRVRPKFYLSNEWGVPFGTTAIAIPFYLARQDLTALHAEHAGHVEGAGRADILRYLRHEMGHVVNYAYRLYEHPDWVGQFGDIERPYEEEYRPEPFSRRFVRHLPGFYAQKHPDEDWAETFAVWLTPGLDWRAEYAGWPVALAKLEYCDRVLADLRGQDPPVTAVDLDEAADDLTYSLEDYYRNYAPVKTEFHANLDGALRAVFEDPGGTGAPPRSACAPERSDPFQAAAPSQMAAAGLIRRLERPLMADVYRWTGHFPEHTRALLRHLAERAEGLGQGYAPDRELEAAVALTALVTALATNHVRSGSYMP
jgi:hypothetical protein